MSNTPKEAYDRITTTSTAWETLRADKTFANLTLEKYRTLIAPSLTARATIARLENELRAAQNQRDDADKVSLAAQHLVIAAVKGDPDETEDGVLYKAMASVRKSERETGLHRSEKAETASS